MPRDVCPSWPPLFLLVLPPFISRRSPFPVATHSATLPRLQQPPFLETHLNDLGAKFVSAATAPTMAGALGPSGRGERHVLPVRFRSGPIQPVVGAVDRGLLVANVEDLSEDGTRVALRASMHAMSMSSRRSGPQWPAPSPGPSRRGRHPRSASTSRWVWPTITPAMFDGRRYAAETSIETGWPRCPLRCRCSAHTSAVIASDSYSVIEASTPKPASPRPVTREPKRAG